jgi:hypothetical protein
MYAMFRHSKGYGRGINRHADRMVISKTCFNFLK